LGLYHDNDLIILPYLDPISPFSVFKVFYYSTLFYNSRDEPGIMDAAMPMEINVITLNCWGLKYLAKFRRERLAEIGNRIAAADPVPHIVGLQECWTQEDYQSIRQATKHILPFGKFYHSGIFGGGLAILSKWPIEESSMWRYPLNGRPTAFFRGDWFVGKGVASARIRYGTGLRDVVEVFTTHVSYSSLWTVLQG
jgi:sphingomyelin phosphodiesterase 2